MNRRVVAVGVIALLLPAMVLAQTDGGTVVADPSTAAPAPQEAATTAPTEPAPAPAPTAQPRTSPAPAPTTVSPNPAPAPAAESVAQTNPAPAPSPVPPAAPAQNVAPVAPAPTEPAPAADATASLEDVQGAVENVSEIAPSVFRPWLSALAGALGGVVFMLGLWELLKRLKRHGRKECAHCGGTGAQADDGVCAVCGGTKKIEKEVEVTIACTHCKGSGTDPCHHCGGTGKMSLPNPPQSEQELEGWPPCDFCGGSGKKKAGAGRDWGEANDAMKGDFACCFCGGKKTMSFTHTLSVDCPLCGKK